MKTISELRNYLTNLGVQNYISERDGIIILSEIRIEKKNRGKGLGTLAMKSITGYADQTGQVILLSPSTDFGASSVGRLEKFYSRFGFVKNKGRNKDYRYSYTMYRRPKNESFNEMKYKDFYSDILNEVYIPVAKNFWMDKNAMIHKATNHQDWIYAKHPEGFEYGGYLKRPDLYEDLYDYAYKKGYVRLIVNPNGGGEHSNGILYYTYDNGFGISNLQKRKLKDYAIENGYELRNELDDTEELNESVDTSYGYWIGKSGEAVSVKDWGGHGESATEYLVSTGIDRDDLDDIESSMILRKRGFCHVAINRRDGIMHVNNPEYHKWDNVPRSQKRKLEDIAESRNLKIRLNGYPIDNINESVDTENSELKSLYKKSDEIFKKLETLRKSPRYYDSPEYDSLRKEFAKVHDRIETLQDESDPEAETELISGTGLIDLDYIEKLYEKDRNNYLLRRLVNNKNKQWVVDFINLRNEVLKKIIEYTKGIPNANIEFQKKLLVTGDGDGEVKDSVEGFFPVVVEVSSSKDDDMTISVSLESDGRFSGVFEGNDEASPETVRLVNKLINPNGKMAKVYGTHGREVVQKIKETGTLPADMYVSPDREYSKGYHDLEGNRETFVGYVNINSLSQESEVDWKTIEPTEIKNFRYL